MAKRIPRTVSVSEDQVDFEQYTLKPGQKPTVTGDPLPFKQMNFVALPDLSNPEYADIYENAFIRAKELTAEDPERLTVVALDLVRQGIESREKEMSRVKTGSMALPPATQVPEITTSPPQALASQFPQASELSTPSQIEWPSASGDGDAVAMAPSTGWLGVEWLGSEPIGYRYACRFRQQEFSAVFLCQEIISEILGADGQEVCIAAVIDHRFDGSRACEDIQRTPIKDVPAKLDIAPYSNGHIQAEHTLSYDIIDTTLQVAFGDLTFVHFFFAH